MTTLFNTERLLAYVDRLRGHRLLIVGDVILDEYLHGRADRLSREAPVPVLEFTARDLIPGGAANPAANMATLGSYPLQVGVIGADPFGEALSKALTDRGIDASHLVIDAERPTTTKTRLMAHMGLRFPQQVARIDRIDRSAISGAVELAVVAHIQQQSPRMAALVASDYLSGLLTTPVVEAIREAGHSHSVLLAADAQGELDKYAGFDLVKCNADEAIAYQRQSLSSDADFAKAGQQIVDTLRLQGAMLITRGSAGLTLAEANGTVTHLRAPHIEDVFDTVGAGDTVLAVMTLALAAGSPYQEAAALANFAAGFVVRKVGNYALNAVELRWAIQTWNVADW